MLVTSIVSSIIACSFQSFAMRGYRPYQNNYIDVESQINSIQPQITFIKSTNMRLQPITNNALQSENEVLKSLKDSLVGENRRLESRNSDLDRKNKTLQCQNDSLASENRRLSSKNEELASKDDNNWRTAFFVSLIICFIISVTLGLEMSNCQVALAEVCKDEHFPQCYK